MDSTQFTAQLEQLRHASIQMLFDKLPRDVEYIRFAIDGGEVVWVMFYTGEGEEVAVDSPRLAFYPVKQVFGNALSGLIPHLANVNDADIPDAVREGFYRTLRDRGERNSILRRPKPAL